MFDLLTKWFVQLSNRNDFLKFAFKWLSNLNLPLLKSVIEFLTSSLNEQDKNNSGYFTVYYMLINELFKLNIDFSSIYFDSFNMHVQFFINYTNGFEDNNYDCLKSLISSFIFAVEKDQDRLFDYAKFEIITSKVLMLMQNIDTKVILYFNVLEYFELIFCPFNCLSVNIFR